MRIIVLRRPGDNPAPEIVDALMVKNSVAFQRGRNFLIENGFDKINLNVVFTPDILTPPVLGGNITIGNSFLGETVSGKVVGWQITVQGMSTSGPVTTDLSVSLERRLGRRR